MEILSFKIRKYNVKIFFDRNITVKYVLLKYLPSFGDETNVTWNQILWGAKGVGTCGILPEILAQTKQR
jgi:hypothetical protein